ncbi:MAG: hypothetical protein ABR577_02860 [Pyrinomonadaceae bacterium]
MRIIALIIGLALAAIGGTIAYRALFLEPSTSLVVTNTNIREVPNTLRTGGGIALLILGACLAFFSARRRS